MPADTEPTSSYNEGVVAVGALLWGEGFLAPGGPQAVRDIVTGLDLAGRDLLDIGCGNGGAEVVLARDCGARVTGIDIEPGLIEQARTLVTREGLDPSVTLRCVKPGPLPFADASYDLVFGKDSWLLIADKAAFFGEVRRVLRPGGCVAASEWLGDGGEPSRDMQRYFTLRGLRYRLAPAERYRQLLSDAGLVDIVVEDHGPAYAATAARELARLRGPLRAEVEDLLGAAEYQAFVDRWEAMTVVLDKGELRSGRLRARRAA